MSQAAKTVEPSKVSIFVTLGSGQDLGITDDGHLVMIDYTGYRIDLGRATARRIELIQKYVGQLKIHAVEEGVL